MTLPAIFYGGTVVALFHAFRDYWCAEKIVKQHCADEDDNKKPKPRLRPPLLSAAGHGVMLLFAIVMELLVIVSCIDYSPVWLFSSFTQSLFSPGV
ncbi:hypothetical protein [Methylobacillus flagellatus]|uniref:hypothetical protein n=1 Tax=Methylobacillus flagellatus TaxID=405 RepID=UPI0018A1B2E4|nr:hypothetical protein [Methylobacillus flagellatus]